MQGQIRLRTRNGGFGIPSAVDLATLVAIASHVTTASRVAVISNTNIQEVKNEIIRLFPHEYSYLGDDTTVAQQLEKPSPKYLQRKYNDFREKAALNQHLTKLSPPETIHFLQQCGDAGLPYNVIPNDSAGTHIDSTSYKMIARYRLNEDFINDTIPCECGQTIDSKATHALSCKSTNYSISGRHSAVLNVVSRTCVAAHLGTHASIKEQQVHQAAYGDPRIIPRIDVFVKNFNGQKTTLADVSIHNPSVTSYANASWNKGPVPPVLEHFNNAKLAQPSSRAYMRLGGEYEFVPLTFTVSGLMHPNTKKWLKQLATKHSAVTGYTFANAYMFILSKILCLLASYNGSMLWRRLCNYVAVDEMDNGDNGRTVTFGDFLVSPTTARQIRFVYEINNEIERNVHFGEPDDNDEINLLQSDDDDEPSRDVIIIDN